MVISERMRPMLENNSAIRAMFEEGKKLAGIYGAENVYDFSLGNPNVPAPKEVRQAFIDILNEEDPVFVHGYMSNSGYEDVRKAIADNLNERFGTSFTENHLIMTVGAASGLNVILKTILNPGDEVIAFAPFFVEYNSYVRNYDGELVVISPNTEDFQPKLAEFEEKITARTRAVIINTPNNPTGVIYSEDTIRRMAAILEKKEKEFGTDILLISDEPYRELAYDGAKVPFVTKYYSNTVIAYSYSKSLSIPGERIGYLLIPDEIADSRDVYTAAVIANRILGSVNAPSLIQRVVMHCVDKTSDIAVYDKNRKLLYESLKEYGYECIRPEGAFYLFVKAPGGDEKKFCEVCKKYRILVVPGSSFFCPGYVRIAYCVTYEQIERSLPAFQAVIEEMRAL